MTQFMGVGSEVFGAISNGRRALGIELKKTYFEQAKKNVLLADAEIVESDDLYTMEEVEQDA